MIAVATGGLSWPTMTDYQEAIQAPKISLIDKELRKGNPVLNKLGLPRPVCGQFASVYELEAGGSRWAVKCFLRNIPDLHRRYEKIAAHLADCPLPYFVTFDYLDEGIRVRGKPYPIVRMEWVDGLPLNHYVAKIRNEPAELEALEDRWLDLLVDLKSVDVAHGDLQHGNVLVAPDGALRLIDYDGMWVPELEGEEANETGHPDYQSPLRSHLDLHAAIDWFAGTVIRIALRALRFDPTLWDKYDNGDNLLFRRQNYLDPEHAELFADLRTLDDDMIDAALVGLISCCHAPQPAAPSRAPRPQTPLSDLMNAPSGNVIKTQPATGRPPAAGTTVAVPAVATRRPRPSTAAATAPAAAPPGSRRVVGRFVTHVLLLAPLTAATVGEQGALFHSGFAEPSTTLATGLGLSVGVGLVSLATLTMLPTLHRLTSSLFFGLASILILLAILGELLVGGGADWSGDDPRQCVLMLTVLVCGVLGLIFEHRAARV